MQPSPAALQPVVVEKPWGREVWYSGVEARGESRVGVDQDAVLLSEFLRRHGRERDIVLLKALHPDQGDLYVELHEVKWEVYAVDAVDHALWPDGGRMLLGIDQRRRRALGERFDAALLAAAEASEAAVQRGVTTRNGGNGKAPEVADVARFLNAVAVRPGDIVTIPPTMPHSLLRGVSVVEFQTPVFERKILAASQPVKTQRTWDSAAAVAAMDAESAPAVASPATTGETARTPHFAVVAIGQGERRIVPPWAVGWVCRGEVRAGGLCFAARTAFVAPSRVELRTSEDAWCLVAEETPLATQHAAGRHERFGKREPSNLGSAHSLERANERAG